MVHRVFGQYIGNTQEKKQEDKVQATDNMNGLTKPGRDELRAVEERRSQISKKMGDYMLQGWTMLASSCDRCGTVLLRNRSGADYCVACEEVDVSRPTVAIGPSDSQDDHMSWVGGDAAGASATTGVAASSSGVLQNAAAIFEIPLEKSASLYQLGETAAGDYRQIHWKRLEAAAMAMVNVAAPDDNQPSSTVVDAVRRTDNQIQAALTAVKNKLMQTTTQLNECRDTRTAIELTDLIGTCARSIKSLQSI